MEPRGVANFIWTTAMTGVMSGYALARQIPGANRERFHHDTRRWAELVARGVGLEVEAHGGESLDPNGTYVFMANHQSHVDIPALFLALPMVPGFLAKAELRKIPLLGRAMEAGGHVFVDRARHGRAVEAIRKAARDLSEGSSIVIFPEGTRSRRAEVLPFKKGGFHLARQAGVPLVPVGIRGTTVILPKHSKSLMPGRCEVHLGAPIAPARIAELSLDDLISEVREQICLLSRLPAAADRSGA